MAINKDLIKKEIESVERGRIEKNQEHDFSDIYTAIDNMGSDPKILVAALVNHKLSYFAQKVIEGLYDIREVSTPIEESGPTPEN